MLRGPPKPMLDGTLTLQDVVEFLRLCIYNETKQVHSTAFFKVNKPLRMVTSFHKLLLHGMNELVKQKLVYIG